MKETTWGPMPEGPVRVTVSRNVMIPMRDGKRLATDIYLPSRDDGSAEPGPFPVILTRTSYDKSNAVMQIEPVGHFFAAHGYAVAIQDLRGRGMSEDVGNYHHIANEGEGDDGFDTIEWLAHQPWSNGKVGMVGTSHSALVQNAAALKSPPSLRALWLDSAPTSGIDWQCRRGGAMAMQMFPALFVHAQDAPEIRDDPAAMARVEEGGKHIRELLMSMPFKPGETPLAAVPNLERILFQYYYQGQRDDFWSSEVIEPKTRWDKFADVPAVFSTGWYDLFTEEVTQQFAELSRLKTSPMRLIVGPWNHTGMRNGSSAVGEVDFGTASVWGYPVYNKERLRWFDRWLKDAPNGVENDPPVRMFTMGGGSGEMLTPTGAGGGVFGSGTATAAFLSHGGSWHAEPEWPPKDSVSTPFYLAEDSALQTEPPIDAGQISWTHDPEHPVPTLGASVAPFIEFRDLPDGFSAAYVPLRARMTTFLPDGPMDQRERPDLFGCAAPYGPVGSRPDVVVFQTQALDAPLEVTGRIEAHLWVSSEALDTDFTARLIDVYPPDADNPDGFQMNISDTILRMRFRDGLDSERPVTPGKIYEISLRLPPTSNIFAAGHRIRLDIASSNFPQFDVNPNTGEPLGRHTHTIKAVNSVHFGPDTPSNIVLPMRPVPA